MIHVIKSTPICCCKYVHFEHAKLDSEIIGEAITYNILTRSDIITAFKKIISNFMFDRIRQRIIKDIVSF